MKRIPHAAFVVLLLSLTACDDSSTDGQRPAADSSATVVVTGDAQSDSALALPTPLPFNAGGLLATNVKLAFPAGEPGEVSVIATKLVDLDRSGATLLVTYRNNTDTAAQVGWTAEGRLDGTIVASGESQGLAVPATVQPGEVGVDYVYFDNTQSIPTNGRGMTYDLSPDVRAADSADAYKAPLTVGEATFNGSGFIGTATNKTGAGITGPYAVNVYCFVNGKLDSMHSDFGDQDRDLADGEHTSFTLDLYGDMCDKFAIGASGYYS